MTIKSCDQLVATGPSITYPERGMPKSTFFNLPEDKRSSIDKAILKEFSEYSYDASSINRIVEYCKIPKGSFYQYFEDKKDAYKYVVKTIVDRKLNYLSPVIINKDEYDFFTVARELFISGLKFARENPELVSIGNRFAADKDHPVYKEVFQENIGRSYELYEDLLAKAIVRGEVRSDIDVRLTAFLISELNVDIVVYHCESDGNLGDESIMELVDKFLDIIRRGIGA